MCVVPTNICVDGSVSKYVWRDTNYVHNFQRLTNQNMMYSSSHLPGRDGFALLRAQPTRHRSLALIAADFRCFTLNTVGSPTMNALVFGVSEMHTSSHRKPCIPLCGLVVWVKEHQPPIEALLSSWNIFSWSSWFHRFMPWPRMSGENRDRHHEMVNLQNQERRVCVGIPQPANGGTGRANDRRAQTGILLDRTVGVVWNAFQKTQSMYWRYIRHSRDQYGR